ncbi:exodeoxyribonuclease V subunit alpha [Ramlibacter sp.]|uniref:exodeoxyribonuclease V subunit alpha n=1 Tax=Ramlibacter sp. TaxID=1917967 RepID=UPI002D2F2B89|nr:exodeoxyribonuclease V subunit alpha [Ramlibacter sp.]HYD76577.1 exodeoxyribonuclease V subunit alpha [Ramlibacter sp.]
MIRDDDDRPGSAPARRLASAFGEHVQRWSLQAGASAEAAAAAARAAAVASLATSSGDACVPLAQVAGEGADAAGLRTLLLASGMVAQPPVSGVQPLVLDAGDRLYLHRYYDYEHRLARRLLQLAGRAPQPITAELRERLAMLFPRAAAAATDDTDWQQVAAALALRNGLAIVSGGPGTGKTSTVARLLACLLEQQPDARIVLAAPTGKAAARMGEALRERAAGFPAHVRERLPAEAFTVHRLLGYHPGRGSFRHDAANPLLLDVLVVDEASMLDLALATRLLEAVPAGARVILLGDKDQLAAVESGAVFSELCTDPSLGEACRSELEVACGLPPGAIQPPAPRADTGDTGDTGLRDSVVWLQRSYRFDAGSGIGQLSAFINAGHADPAVAWLRAGADAGVAWHEPGSGAQAVTLARAGLQRYFDAVLAAPHDVDAASEAFASFRVLCAVREGPQGVETLNQSLTQQARAALAGLPEALRRSGGASPWFAGRPVMVLANDYALQLFNGDIGLALPDSQGDLQVWFPKAGGGWRAVAPVRLPAHETAFAMTVHKAQGSEFDAVLLVLPAAQSPVLTRELLYTGVTRARSRVDLFAGEDALRAAIGRGTERHTGLLARLRECAD